MPEAPLRAAHLGQHVSGVAARLLLGLVTAPWLKTVVAQVLVKEAAAGRGDHAGAADVAADQKATLSASAPNASRMNSPARQRFIVVVGGDVGGRTAWLRRFRPWRASRRRRPVEWSFSSAQTTWVALRLVVLDEVAAEPEFIGRLGKRSEPQADRYADGAGDVAAVLDRRPRMRHRSEMSPAGPSNSSMAWRVEVDHLGVRCRPYPGCC